MIKTVRVIPGGLRIFGRSGFLGVGRWCAIEVLDRDQPVGFALLSSSTPGQADGDHQLRLPTECFSDLAGQRDGVGTVGRINITLADFALAVMVISSPCQAPGLRGS